MRPGRPSASASPLVATRRRGRLLLLLIALSALCAPTGLTRDAPEHRVLRVHVYHDEAYAAQRDVDAAVAERLAFANRVLERAGVVLVLGEASLAPSLAPCGGSGSGLDWLMGQPSPHDLRVYLAAPPPAGARILGCAIQDGIASGLPLAALHDPPYVGVTLGGTPLQREHHANLLFAHEVGHVLGGLHALALPADPSVPLGGTIMSPVLQYNLPLLSGASDPHTGACLQQGNVCRIREVAHGVGGNAPSLVMDA